MQFSLLQAVSMELLSLLPNPPGCGRLYLDFIDGLKPYRLLARDKETQKELILAYMPPKMPTAYVIPLLLWPTSLLQPLTPCRSSAAHRKLQLLLRRVLALFRKAHSSDYRRVDTDLKKLEAATRDASFDTDDMRVLLAMSPGETDRVLTEFYLGNALSRRTKLSPLQLYSHPWLKVSAIAFVLTSIAGFKGSLLGRKLCAYWCFVGVKHCALAGAAFAMNPRSFVKANVHSVGPPSRMCWRNSRAISALVVPEAAT